MSTQKAIGTEVQNAWSKLNSRWQGEDANAFHRQYVVKLSEAVESFEKACDDLEKISTELAMELHAIEQSLANW